MDTAATDASTSGNLLSAFVDQSNLIWCEQAHLLHHKPRVTHAWMNRVI
jgi:hypothetical protein